jgi:hypothetical protein
MTVLMKLVIVALVLISSAISSNGQQIHEFYESECKTLNKLMPVFSGYSQSFLMLWFHNSWGVIIYRWKTF